MDINIMSGYSFHLTPFPPPSPTCTTSESQLKKTLTSSNQFLISQIDKNKKFIKSLEAFLAWISSCPVSVAPELTSLILSNNLPDHSFDFELRLASELNKFICKSKYFSFVVELFSVTGLEIPKTQKVPIEVKLYTSEHLPKPIVVTMQGRSVIRGRDGENLVFCEEEGRFLARIKMQITEVSSHFVNGTINLVVCKAEEVRFGIRPLLIRDIVIKAKEKTCIRCRELEE